MDVALSGVALALMLAAGLGLALLTVAPGSDLWHPGGLAALAVVFGAAAVSLLQVAFGQAVAGDSRRLIIAVACCALLAAGAYARRGGPHARRRLVVPSRGGAVWAGLAVVLVGAVAWTTFRRTLGWDGLLVWEFKAHLACLNDGVVPAAYYADPSRRWSHPEYPLLIPLAQTWVYAWLGRCDQEFARAVFPLFYAATLGLLATGVRLLGVAAWAGWFGSGLTIFVPLLVVGDGSATSGYADFPLATVYLAALLACLAYVRAPSTANALTVGLVSAVLPWTKQEGLILWLCVAGLAAANALCRRRPIDLALAVVPGLGVVVAWQLFLRQAGTVPGQDFLPLTLATLAGNWQRLGPISGYVLAELLDRAHWGWFWPAVAAAAVLGGGMRPSLRQAVLTAGVAGPLSLYAGIYVFSAWTPYSLHIESSLPRLLIHLAPAGLLLLAAAAPGRARDETAALARGD